MVVFKPCSKKRAIFWDEVREWPSFNPRPKKSPDFCFWPFKPIYIIIVHKESPNFLEEVREWPSFKPGLQILKNLIKVNKIAKNSNLVKKIARYFEPGSRIARGLRMAKYKTSSKKKSPDYFLEEGCYFISISCPVN